MRDEAAKNKEATRTEDNEFNIRKQFLDNAVNAIKEATYGQYNIVICTDQEHDDFQALTGEVLPMDLLNLEVSEGKNVNFQVYVFDTGRYLRHGRWERDAWWWYGSSKQWTDPVAMHVHFEKAQTKLDAAAIGAAADKKAEEDKKAAAITAAAKKTQDETAAKNAAQLTADAKAKAAAAAAAAQQSAQGGKSYPLLPSCFPLICPNRVQWAIDRAYIFLI